MAGTGENVVDSIMADTEVFADDASMDAWEAEMSKGVHGRGVKEVVKEQEEAKAAQAVQATEGDEFEFELGDDDVVDVTDAANAAAVMSGDDEDFLDDDGNLIEEKKALLDKLPPAMKKAVEKLVSARVREAQKAQGAAQQYQTSLELARGYQARAEKEARAAADAKMENMKGIGTFVAIHEKEAERDLKAAQAALVQAHADGESQALAEAITAVQKATYRVKEVEQWRVDYDRERSQFESWYETQSKAPVEPVDTQPQQKQQPQAQALPDTAVFEDKIRTNAWVAANASWYGKDPEKTEMAKYVDAKLREHGVHPIKNPQLYWQYLDKGIAELEEQATAAKAGQQKQNTTPRVSSAAPATATARGGKQTVKLTAQEQKYAQMMGIPLKEYAAEKALMQRERAK